MQLVIVCSRSTISQLTSGRRYRPMRAAIDEIASRNAGQPELNKNGVHDLPMHIRQPEVPPLVPVRQPLVIHPQAMQ